jgi:preprotein translocase subunit SecF
VLDRIREMMRKYKKMSTAQIIDMSVNAVLPRTIMTATTVFLALLSLAIFGGQVIRSFSLAMIWGVVVATYSSVFICSPMLIYLGLRSEDVTAPAAGDAEPKEAPPETKPAAPAPAAPPARTNAVKPSTKRAKSSRA